MLFSDDLVATTINQKFEPVWQAVRPVPMVRLDFGNGRVVTRTLHGNIATYVCTADGQVLDILPGIYDRETYFDRLGEFFRLHGYFHQGEKANERLAAYHRARAEALAQGKAPPQLVNLADLAKAKIERVPRYVLLNGESVPKRDFVDRRERKTDAEKLANWKELVEDSKVNESVRRRQIHSYLAEHGSLRPDGVTKWLYREVLHADLEDPYLGLGKALFANYPFEDGTPR